MDVTDSQYSNSLFAHDGIYLLSRPSCCYGIRSCSREHYAVNGPSSRSRVGYRYDAFWLVGQNVLQLRSISDRTHSSV
ncbi:hypothetical protein AHF37_00123 [Paragonimus kellicotti]|nr:hypothetical protein AHF37_00123 [Paragonimus kellicotti]